MSRFAVLLCISIEIGRVQNEALDHFQVFSVFLDTTDAFLHAPPLRVG